MSFKSMEQGRQAVTLNWMSQDVSDEAGIQWLAQCFLFADSGPGLFFLYEVL